MKLTAALLERVERLGGDAAEVERILGDARAQLDRALSADDDSDALYRDYAELLGVVEDTNEARMYASMREEDAAYLRGYASDLGLRPDECVTVEIEIER